MSIGGDFRDYSDDDREEAYAMSHGVCAHCDGDGCFVPEHLTCPLACGDERLVESKLTGLWVHEGCLSSHEDPTMPAVRVSIREEG